MSITKVRAQMRKAFKARGMIVDSIAVRYNGDWCAVLTGSNGKTARIRCEDGHKYITIIG